MTLTVVLTMALRRAGLSTSTTGTHWSIARDYFNLGMQDMASRTQWRWLRKKSAALTLTVSQAKDSLASDVLYPLDFYDSTNNSPIDILSPSRVHDFDPDGDETGQVRFVSLTGIESSSTGYWEATWTPKPDATDSVYYTYQSSPADKTSSNDGTDLATTMPVWAQHCMVYFVAGQYKGEKGDLEGEQQDMREYEKRLQVAIANNTNIDMTKKERMGKRRHRSREGSGRDVPFRFTITPGSL